LFVYGTLRRANDNPWARRLHRAADFAGVGSVKGKLGRVGRYFAVLPKGSRRIKGELFRLKSPCHTLVLLDRYEGAAYERVQLPIRLHSGRTVEAWVYVRATESMGNRKNRLRQMRQR
jgi:gamma-glutamylcyclotransferase (GGCT)/AIG2-like uncharacterized protein YtfP